MTYVCEVCGAEFTGTAENAFEAGWDTPERFMSHCKCANCSINKTTWWRLVVEKKEPSHEDIKLLAYYNSLYATTNSGSKPKHDT